jgi:hypothetical protein
MGHPSTQRYTQIPILTNWRQTDSVAQLRMVMEEHEYGVFTSSAPLWEEMLTDDRIAAVVDTRIGGLMCAEMSFSAGGDKRKAKQLADAMGGDDRTRDDGLWRRIVSHETAKEILKWKVGLGVAFGPVEWATTKDTYTPRIKCWHPKHLRWDHGKRRFYVVTLEGQNIELPDTEEEPRSNGDWFVWGGYRSWMNGLIRSLGPKYVDRQWNERDWSRRNERFGMAIIEGSHPASASNEDKENWQNQLANMGNEPTIMTPQPNEKTGTAGYGIKIHTLNGEGWQCFSDRKNSLDIDIAVRVLGQELTTTTGPNGNRALGEVHEKIRTDIKRADSEFFTQAREQVLCWHAYHNLGDPTLAPYPQPMIGSPDNPLDDAQELLTIVTAIEKAPPELDVVAILEAHGMPILEGDALTEAVERKRVLQPQQSGGGVVTITPSAAAAVTKVNEVRAQQGMPPLDADGDLTVAEYQAKHSTVISQAANAEAGESQIKSPPVDLRAVAQLSEAVALRATGTGKARKQAKYQVAQAQIAARVASRAMRPFVEKVLAALDGAQSFEECRRLIVAEARKSGADMDQVAKLFANVNLLARLHGREAALANVLK